MSDAGMPDHVNDRIQGRKNGLRKILHWKEALPVPNHVGPFQFAIGDEKHR